MKSMVTVPRNTHSPKRVGSAPKDGAGPPPPSPPPGSGTRGGAPASPVIAGASLTVPSNTMSLAAGGHAGRLVLHHVVARGLGVAVFVRPAVHGGDLARPVAVGRG